MLRDSALERSALFAVEGVAAASQQRGLHKAASEVDALGTARAKTSAKAAGSSEKSSPDGITSDMSRDRAAWPLRSSRTRSIATRSEPRFDLAEASHHLGERVENCELAILERHPHAARQRSVAAHPRRFASGLTVGR